jgi:2-iminobutanoate/2-iminopropanoate deaminase
MAKPVGPYTPIVRAGEWLIASGQVGLGTDGLVGGGMAAELRQAFANLRALLESEGAALNDVVKTTVFLVYMAEFGDHRPARSAMAVAELPIGARVEIEAWAHPTG